MRDFFAALGSLFVLAGALVICLFFALYDSLREVLGKPAVTAVVTKEPFPRERLAEAA